MTAWRMYSGASAGCMADGCGWTAEWDDFWREGRTRRRQYYALRAAARKHYSETHHPITIYEETLTFIERDTRFDGAIVVDIHDLRARKAGE